MNKPAVLLQIAGLAAVSAGVAMVALWAGVVTAGLSLVALGIAVERPPDRAGGDD